MAIGEINPTAVLEAVKNGSVFVDVREPYEIDEVAYDIPNAILIPLGEIQSRMNEIPKDVNVIVGCRSGGRSMNACAFLSMQGYTDLTNLSGGIMSWVDNDCPTK
ncbi:rhodanese-like domain-containing protein [Crocinitomix catalasitica]|uniref:rhodanese-like domain-containing protein n=1 Tax=Crocinitomix catalasitica TaxID=184607 RepID=UPI0004879031|nr:rhodanese-like domain-containing protein [Crocinitomix catalasitica]